MKKTLLVLCFVSSLSFSFAQSVKFGLKAGVNLSSLSSSGSGLNLSSDNLTGFHVGGFAELGLGVITLQPGVVYTTKGGSFSTTIGGGGTAKDKLNYIEVPVNVLYKVPVGVGKIFFGAGPYVGYGISGTETATGVFTSSGNSSQTRDIKFGNGTTDDFKNPDFGLNFLAGFRLNSGLEIGAGYGLGLSNLSTDNTSTAKNHSFSISLGYFFL